MKAGWKTRMDERRYFEAKLDARRERAYQVAAAIAQAEANKTAMDFLRKHGNPDRPWINLSKPGQTRIQWEQEQRAKAIPPTTATPDPAL